MTARSENPASDTRLCEFIARVSAACTNDDERLYITGRWAQRLGHARKKTVVTRRRHYWCRTVSLTGAVVSPILVTAATQSSGSARHITVAVSVGTSILVAVATGIAELLQLAERWRSYRALRAALEREGWLLLQRSDTYAVPDRTERLAVFVARVEGILAGYESAYAQVIQRIPDSTVSAATTH